MKSHLWVFALLLIGLSVLVGTTNASSAAQPSGHLPAMGEPAPLERSANLVVPDESGPFIFTKPPVATPGKTLVFSPDWTGQTEFNRPQTPAAAPQEVMTQQATAIAAGIGHTCALTTGGGVKCWGAGGTLGGGSITDRYTPVDVSGLTSGVAAIAAGAFHTCAVTTSGGVKCWGYNDFGVLGDGTTTSRLTPVDVSGLTSGVVAIAANWYHTCAVTTAGGVKCWGGNRYGELGDGTTTSRLTPVDVSGLTSGVAAIAAGLHHTCAVTAGGGVKCWGDNSTGQLGDGTGTPRLTPVNVSGLTSGVAAIAAGVIHTCAVTTSGGVKCWGYNSGGQLGDGTTTDRVTPVNVNGLTSGVAAIAAGWEHTCAVTAAGGVKCWGGNRYGELGDGTATNRLTPVDVSGLTSGGTAIAAGWYHTCPVTVGGGVKCWGDNDSGQLGDGTANRHLTPVNVSGLTSGVAAIATNREHTCAVTTSGGVNCWGDNRYGRLGDGTATSRYTPADVSGMTSGVVTIAAGYGHTCAVTTSGGVNCWGGNWTGQLGDGTQTDRYTPVGVSGLTSGVTAVAAGDGHTCALTTGGGVKCWGDNWAGQLGDGTRTDRLTPVDVSGLTSGVTAIAAGWGHTCALTTGGGVKCWGWNSYGELGDGTGTTRLTPVDVNGLTSGVAAIAANSKHTCAVTAAGGVKCWGFNNSGQLGIDPGWTPVDVVGFGDGLTFTISGSIVDPNNFPIPNARVSTNTGRSTTTNANGNYTITNLITGTYTLAPSKAGYAFSPTSRNVTVPASGSGQNFVGISGSLVANINQTTNTALNSLARIEADAAAIANDGVYFRGAIGADSARLVANVVFNMADVIGGINQVSRLQQGARLSCPGCYVPGTWNVQFSSSHPAATRLLDIGFTRLEAVPATQIAEFIGYGSPQFYGRVLNTGARYITKEAAKSATRTIFANMDDGMTAVSLPAIQETSGQLSIALEHRRDQLLANLPAMSPAMRIAYTDDLTGRTLALLVLGEQLDNERMTLTNFRQAHGQSPNTLLNLLLRFTAKSLAAGFFDGPGTAAVGGALTLFDGYMDGQRLDESMQMYALATGALLGTPDALRQTYTTAYTGLDRIALGLPANRVTGQINSVTHRHQIGDLWQFWEETASWSNVVIANNSSSEATFRVQARYLADTTRFNVPWATLDIVEEATITLMPGESDVVRLDYKRANGTKGFSPRSETCFPGAGCVPAATVYIDVLASNGAGTYYVAGTSSVWNPQQLTLAGERMAFAPQSSEIIDPVLTTHVLSAPWTQEYETYLWINNPFTETLSVTVTQELPLNVSLLDPGSGTQQGNSLTWNTVVSPTAMGVVTFTFSFPDVPDTPNVLPPASLTLVDPQGGGPLTALSNETGFYALWPVTLDYASPGYVLPGVESTVQVSVTNWLNVTPVTGTLAIDVTDALSNTIYSQTKNFTVAAVASNMVEFTLPSIGEKGHYQIQGQITINGATTTAFLDRLQVGLPGPWLHYEVSPIGTVYPDATLTYALGMTNTTGIPLSNAVLTATIPAYVAVIPGSISGGGVIQSGEVRWSFGTIPANQAVNVSFGTRVNHDTRPSGTDPIHIVSESRLTANEIQPTWGPTTWNTVWPPVGIYLPLILRP